jgi:hypothetical protein
VGARDAGARRDRPTDDAGTPTLPALLAALLGAPAAWTAHLLVAYGVVALDCTSAWGGARGALVGLTAVTLGAAVASGLLALRLWRRARAADRPAEDGWDARLGDRTSRVAFLMLTGVALAVLFAIGIVYQAVPVALVPTCAPAAP